jgi:twitching motility two-component system response regulator PilH
MTALRESEMATTVLIVDDSATDVHVLKGMLEKNGYQTSLATTAEEGMKKAKAEKPDVILMDVVMPGMSGFQATRHLSQDPETAAIPVIIVSSKDMDTDKIWGIRQGARDYVTKPVTEKDLISKIRAVLST